MNRFYRISALSCFALATMVVALLVGNHSAFADGGADHQILRTRPIDLGVSGINREDRCFVRGGNFVICGTGTLGSLVEDGGGTQYILSNNHIFGELNQATIGDDVIQPGYLDDCFQDPGPNVVADLSEFVTLDFSGADNLVDAGIAEIRAGEVDTSGTILDIGTIGTTTAAPFVGQAVKKSGRTTGLTNGTVNAISVTVNVGYLACGAKQNETQVGHFVDQIEITPGSFIAGGDSGSLMVDSNTNQAVGLLFAGSSFSAIANKIDNVLCAFSTPLAMAGGTPNCGGGCTSDPECDDGNPCNGSETCDLGSGTCQPGTPIDCNDNDACTDDGCDPGTGNCTHTPTDCDDGDACTVDTCDSVTGCANTSPACGVADGCCPAGCDSSNDPDCPAGNCGDGVCAGGGVEDCNTCPADCRCAGGPNCNRGCCGDGACTGSENANNCPVDCGAGGAAGQRVVPIHRVNAIKQRNSDKLFAIPDVVGHGVTLTDAGAPAIVVYLAKENAAARAQIRATLNGVPVKVKVTGPFTAYQACP